MWVINYGYSSVSQFAARAAVDAAVYEAVTFGWYEDTALRLDVCCEGVGVVAVMDLDLVAFLFCFGEFDALFSFLLGNIEFVGGAQGAGVCEPVFGDKHTFL